MLIHTCLLTADNLSYMCFPWKIQCLGGRKIIKWAFYRNVFASAGGKGKQTFLDPESKIGSCCVMDTLGSITSLYQVIQEYLIFSVGQGLQEIVSLIRSLDTLEKQASISTIFFLCFA